MDPRKIITNLGDRGVALLLVVSVISLLTVVILQFNRSMRNNLTETWYFKDRERLYALVESGIDLGIAVLHSDSYYNDYDSLHDPWSKTGEKPVTQLGGGSELTITITDLSGRFPLSSLVASAREGGVTGGGERVSPKKAREILYRLLISGDFALEDDFQAREIVDSLVDWLDSDDNELDNGAENNYYQSLESPYSSRNGLMETPNELLAVKGVTPELLFGNNEKNGLADYVTVYGTDGKININSAGSKLLQALDERINSEEAELLVEYRADENVAEALGNNSWYRDVPGWPGDIELDDSLITTTSMFFRIRAEAVSGDAAMKMTAFVKRSGKKEIKILYRKLE